MAQEANLSSENGEDRVRNEQEYCADNIRINSLFSVETINPESAVELRTSQRNFSKGGLISMDDPEESVSAFTDANASTSNNASLDIGIVSRQGTGSSGPPSNIIQQLDDDSAPLINLDSIQDSELESDVSDLNGIIAEEDDNKTSWLNIDSSSTSQGSQGSYADQVPTLLGSHGSNGIDNDHLPNENLLPPQLPSPENTIPEQYQSAHSRFEQYQSAHSRFSHFPSLEAPQNSNLDDILGPKGESTQCDLGQDEEALRSDLDDILGSQTDGKPSDLDDTLGPYEGSTVGPTTDPPSEKMSIEGNKVDHESEDVRFRVSEEKGGHVAIDHRTNNSISNRSTPIRVNATAPKNDNQATSYSQVARSSVDLIFENSHRDAIDRRSDWATLVDDTLHRGKQSSMCASSRGETSSSNSYTKKSGCTLSPDSACYTIPSSQDNSRSRINRFSSEESSQISPTKHSQFSHTEHISCSQYTSATSTNGAGSRSRINRFSSEEYSRISPSKHSQFSHTEHTRSSQYTSATSANGTDSGSRINRFNTDESSQISPTRHSQFSHTEHTSSSQYTSATSANGIRSINDSEDIDDSRGGRMWREAQLQADNSKDRPLNPRAKKFAESIMARTRSRADPNALFDNSPNTEAIEKPTRSMIKLNAQEEGGFIRSTSIARKRGKVVQLLTIGLLSFLIAFLGGFLVLSSCHFLSAAIQVGENAEELNLHFGLWKYSPATSASQGYTYCSSYDGDFIASAPWFGRISSLIALLCGAFSLGVLWLYLVLGRCVKNTWNIAVYAAAFSGVLQLSTLSILAGTICKEQVCTIGPAGIISVVSGCFYFLLVFEMHYNSPIANISESLTHDISREEPHYMVTNLEMTDFEFGAKAYVHRISFGNTNPCPTLDQAQIRNQNHIGETMNGRKNPSYVPPAAIV